jgi:hypothetical protein
MAYLRKAGGIHVTSHDFHLRVQCCVRSISKDISSSLFRVDPSQFGRMWISHLQSFRVDPSQFGRMWISHLQSFRVDPSQFGRMWISHLQSFRVDPSQFGRMWICFSHVSQEISCDYGILQRSPLKRRVVRLID